MIIQLMRAADDIALANWGLRRFKKEQPHIRRHIQLGACRYFIRLQCGHLSEALPLVASLRREPELVRLLRNCSPDAKRAYQRLLECLPGGRRRDRFERWVLPIRNRLAFHYDPSLTVRGLRRRARNPWGRKSSITQGSDIDLWRFNVADDIEDTIICRELWRIPAEANLRREADRRADFGAGACRDLLRLTGELASRYLTQYAT